MLAAAVGCSFADGGGTPSVPTPSPQAAEFCRALHEELPKTVDGLELRTTEPASDFTAAWGDPAVRLRCGVPRPEVLTPGSDRYDPTADAAEVNGVSWLLEQQDDGYRFTTTGRKAFVELTVPGEYAPEINALTDLADAVARTVPTEL